MPLPPINEAINIIYESNNFTFPSANPPVPQNIRLSRQLSDFSDIAVVHFFLKQSDANGGRSTEKETDIVALKELPLITDADFTNTDTRKTHAIEIPRLHALSNTRQFGNALLLVGKKSESELRISCSHPVISGGTLRIKVVDFA